MENAVMSAQSTIGRRLTIVRDPKIMHGAPCFRATRVPFQNLLGYLEAGVIVDAFVVQFPTVTREMAITALDDAKESLLASIG